MPVDHHLTIQYHAFDTSESENDDDDHDQDILAALGQMFPKDRATTTGARRPIHQQQKRREQEQAKVRELNALPEFQPFKPFEGTLINRFTPLHTLSSLLAQTKHVRSYCIDTESDFSTQRAAIIQVQFIDDDADQSTVLILEMTHLPRPSSPLFQAIEQLMTRILHPSNTIYGWDNVRRELLGFVSYQLFTADRIRTLQFYDVQSDFKSWYNLQYAHDQQCPRAGYTADDPDCCCAHRPYKDRHNRWSLQMAMAKTFRQYLDKRLQKTRWSMGLDYHLDPAYQHDEWSLYEQSWDFCQRQKHRDHLIRYAAHDCLCVTQIALLIKNRRTLEQLRRQGQHARRSLPSHDNYH